LVVGTTQAQRHKKEAKAVNILRKKIKFAKLDKVSRGSLAQKKARLVGTQAQQKRWFGWHTAHSRVVGTKGWHTAACWLEHSGVGWLGQAHRHTVSTTGG
jgi:hypothetical protein